MTARRTSTASTDSSKSRPCGSYYRFNTNFRESTEWIDVRQFGIWQSTCSYARWLHPCIWFMALDRGLVMARRGPMVRPVVGNGDSRHGSSICGTCLRFMTHGRLMALFITGSYRMRIPDPDWYHVHESRNVILYRRMARTNVSVRRLQSLKWKFQK